MRILLLSLFLTLPVAAVTDSDLPDGKGKDAVENTCTDCHSLQRITSQRLNEEGWNGIVREMIENGASINPDDIKVIISYLAKNFGPDKKVNVNKAPVDEIASVLQLTLAEADTIVEYRTRNGSFKSLSELQKVNGLADKIKSKKAFIEF